MNRKHLPYWAITLLLYLTFATPAFAHEEPEAFSFPVNILIPTISALIGGFVFSRIGKQTTQLSGWSIVILFELGVAGIVHLAVALLGGGNLLLLNGAGFLILAIAWGWFNHLIPGGRKTVSAVLFVYTLITLVGYFILHDQYDFVGIFSKITELIILYLLGKELFKPAID